MKCLKCHADNPDTSRFCGNCATQLTPAGQPPPVLTKTLESPVYVLSKGSLVAGKYRVLEEIGRGGMGVVYTAEDTKLKRTVALKFLPHQWTADAAARERFIHEAQAASALDHPNICNIHEIEETEDGRMYIAMAFYEGESLRERIKRGPLKTEEAVNIASQVAQGMANAHQASIVHRDIKPANILITKTGIAKIVDFGLAKLAGQVKLTREGTTVGTVAYMSPEQARGDAVDQRTDIWSLGVVLYEMLAGHLPFKGDFEQTLIHSILKSEPEPITKFRKDLTAGLEQIIAKALAKNPAARYQTMDELLEDLNAVAEGLKPLRAKTGFFRGRILGLKKIYAFTSLALLILLTAVAFLFVFPKRGQIIDTLAVLPFVNRSQDPGQDGLADELTDTLIKKFHAVKWLQVPMSRTVAAYKNTKKSYREIGRELKVKAVLEGAMLRSGDRVKISISLADASTERPLWIHDYEKDIKDIFALASEVALDIFREIQVRLSPDEQKRLASSKKVDDGARDAFIEYKKIFKTFDLDPSLERWKSAYAYLQKAADIDPGFSPIYWAMVTHWRIGHEYSIISYKYAIAGAEAAMEKGLISDRDSSDMHIAAGELYFIKWDWEGAKKAWSRAVELAPGDPWAHLLYSAILLPLGFFDEAIAEVKKAIQVDSFVRGSLGAAYLYARRYEEAIAAWREGLILEPESAFTRNMLAVTYALNKMPDDAVAEAEKSISSLSASEKGLPHLNVALVYALVGRRDDALKLLNECLASRKGKPIDTATIVEIYSALGEIEEAFKWLEKTYQDHVGTICWLKVDPILDNLRSDPRFKEYLKKAGFEK
jgi:serine/threonine protein kinase/Flp pilus assembly protein TadD